MTGKRAIGLAVVLGLVALLLGWVLVSLTRDDGAKPADIYQTTLIDSEQMFALTRTLSSDALEGRAPGTAGSEAARGFLLKRYETLGLEKYGESFEHSFGILPRDGAESDGPSQGINLLAWLPGKTPGLGPMIVMTAHYDHVGVRDGAIHNGADDNASGTAAMLAVAEYFTKTPPEHDILFAALDAEEVGLLGARELVRNPPIAFDRMALNINLDMVSRSNVNELYAAGPGRFPMLAPMIEEVAAAAPVTLLMGHDTPKEADPMYDWTMMSDHGPFFEAGIAFIYLGVEDHPDYHKPTDDFDAIPLDFFARSGETIAMVVEAADEQLDTLIPAE